MKMARKNTVQTRQSLLSAAAEVFAGKGYRDATIAEICARAGANIAAVNYHFRDKESLYREAWRHSFQESVAAHPPDGGVAEDASPEERLRGMIRAALERIADKKNQELLIVHKELASPTGLLEEVIHKEIRPFHDKIEGVLRELLGPGAGDEPVRFCVFSVISQCLNPLLAKRARTVRKGGMDEPPGIGDLAAYAAHVARFSLAGIRALREVNGKMEKNTGKRRSGGRNK